MRIPGKRIKRTKLIQSEKYVVAVEIEMVIPDEDPSEPCLESKVVEFLKLVKMHADNGNIDWLTQHGKVYEANGAAYRPSVTPVDKWLCDSLHNTLFPRTLHSILSSLLTGHL